MLVPRFNSIPEFVKSAVDYATATGFIYKDFSDNCLPDLPIDSSNKSAIQKFINIDLSRLEDVQKNAAKFYNNRLSKQSEKKFCMSLIAVSLSVFIISSLFAKCVSSSTNNNQSTTTPNNKPDQLSLLQKVKNSAYFYIEKYGKTVKLASLALTLLGCCLYGGSYVLREKKENFLLFSMEYLLSTDMDKRDIILALALSMSPPFKT